MIKIGITGDNGFVGSHLKNQISLFKGKYEVVPFKKDYFSRKKDFEKWVTECDVIVHLAAKNRHSDPNVITTENVGLVEILIDALESSKATPQIIFSSSSQENNGSIYGDSKRRGRNLLEKWGDENNAIVNGLIIPNVFGPFGKPYFNSFIATFCHQLTHDESPLIENDSQVKLIYIDELVSKILDLIDNPISKSALTIKANYEFQVSEILDKLCSFKDLYFLRGQIPELKSSFDIALFNTFRSFIDYQEYFPQKLKQNIDQRGAFVEVIRLGIGGQVSFSTTVPGITRGNHFHTRKIERFAVIKGEAIIKLRKVDQGEIFEYILKGTEPAYVDMPIWYTHNITNVGDEELYTIFWINEPYNSDDPDTFFIEV